MEVMMGIGSDSLDGTLPYSYLWSNGSTQNIANGLTSGYVYVEVLDSNNCSVFDSVFIQQPQEISLIRNNIYF